MTKNTSSANDIISLSVDIDPLKYYFNLIVSEGGTCITAGSELNAHCSRERWMRVEPIFIDVINRRIEQSVARSGIELRMIAVDLNFDYQIHLDADLGRLAHILVLSLQYCQPDEIQAVVEGWAIADEHVIMMHSMGAVTSTRYAASVYHLVLDERFLGDAYYA